MTLLRDKVLNESTLRSHSIKILAMIDQWNATQPVSQLPPELISLTVALGLPIADYLEGSAERSPRRYMETLASLAMTSRTWRNAVIGTPSLWGLLSTSLPSHINRISLERSGNCPLMVEIITSISDQKPPNLDEFLDITVPHWSRWSHALLYFSPPKRVIQHLSLPAPLLEKFGLWVYPKNLVPIDLFGGCAPRLQDISVYGTPLVWDSEIFRGLRKLRLESIVDELISSDHILAILADCPSLELLNIQESEMAFSPLPPPSSGTPIQLPNLKTIIFVGVCVQAVGNILPFIRAPNCGYLQLEMDEEGVEPPFDTADFLSRSLSHFDTFLRSTIAFHGSSQLQLFQALTEWVCSGVEFDAPCFVVHVPIIGTNPTVSWVSQYLGHGLSPAHRMEVIYRLRHVDSEDFAGLQKLAGFPDVQRFITDLSLPSAEAILGVLGTPHDVTGPPSFSGLEVLQLGGAYGWPFPEFEMMLKRRYGELERGVLEARPIRIVLALPFARPLRGKFNSRLQFDHLSRIRTLRGVESVTLQSRFGPEGMPACIYDDAAGEYCNPM
ncbi:hypothetical protein FS837_003071 [Tulasnella sp. UAMH 9824]|nr:hypothetical protein FS837_003071 [Tulasnella sp. UAMH 9824]